MKKTSSLLFIMFSFILFLLLISAFFFSTSSIPKSLNCSGDITFYKGKDTKSNVNINFIINKNDSRVYLRGFYKEKENTHIINRLINIKTNINKSHLQLTNYYIQKRIGEDPKMDSMNTALPVFYNVTGSGIDFYIYKINDNSYLFTNGYLPSFYCRVR